MPLDEFVRLCRAFEAAGLAFWIDGGWGVDVLLCEETRPHSDLDLAVLLSDLDAFGRLLAALSYQRNDRPGDPDWNRVFERPDGCSVDLHGFVLDDRGNGILGNPADGSMYPAGSLDGKGTLGGLTLRCIAAPFVLQFRNGFAPRAVDHHDVTALCNRFGLARPSRFRQERDHVRREPQAE